MVHPRCTICQSKLTVVETVLKCECQLSFCMKHYPKDLHNCIHSVKKEKIILEKVVKDKIIDRI